MAAAFRGRRLQSGMAAAPRQAAWVSSASPSASLSHAEEPWAVIVGTPGWRLPALAEAQQAEGAAAALRLAYREHGEGLFDHLTGAFALAILDSANRRAQIGRAHV